MPTSTGASRAAIPETCRSSRVAQSICRSCGSGLQSHRASRCCLVAALPVSSRFDGGAKRGRSRAGSLPASIERKTLRPEVAESFLRVNATYDRSHFWRRLVEPGAPGPEPRDYRNIEIEHGKLI